MKKQILTLIVTCLTLWGATACTAPPVPTAVPSEPATAEETEASSEDAPSAPQETVEDTAVSANNMLAPEAIPGETYYAPFPKTIALDGDLSDWEGVPRITIPEVSDVVTVSTEADFAATADDEYLYFMAEVSDDSIVTGEHGENYWNEDSAEFYINATGDLGLTSYKPGVAQITVPPLNIGREPEDAVFGGVQGDTAEALAKVVETDTGYAIELAVPLSTAVWEIDLGHGQVIGFQAHLNGATTGDRNSKAIWSLADQSDQSYQNPSLFGQLVFFEIGQTAVVANVPTPTPAPFREPVPADALYKQADAPIAERVEDLLGRLTLAEKIGQMTLIEKNSIVSADITALGIGGLLSGGGGYPSEGNSPEQWAAMVDGFQQYALDTHFGIPLIYGVDAVHGHSNVRGAVIFPHNIGLGAANDPDLMRRIGEITAVEMAATGIYWNYAPAVSVPQDIRWGRTYEGYSEDTAVVSALATAYLQGLQGEDLTAPDTTMATPKHFVGDGGTVWGTSTTNDYQIDQGVTDIDEETLRRVHLPPYTAVIEAGAESIMISYSSWGGQKMHGQAYLIQDVLRGELGFEGMIVSDWAGVDQIDPDYYTAVVTSINAGVDLNMVPYDYNRFIRTMTEAVEAGDISQERIDDAVRRVLTAKFKLGLFEQPFSNPDYLSLVGSDAHRDVAREAVAKSAVLLKNEGDLLPFAPDTTLLVAGQAADDIGIQSGGWTIEWQGQEGDITPGTTIVQALSEAANVVYDPHGRFDEADLPEDTPRVCLAVVGERPYAEGLGDDDQLRLPVNDLRVLRRLEETCDQLAVVLLSGRPLLITEELDNWDALVAAWLPGTEGSGVADVLLGTRPFTGQLSYTWPRATLGAPETDPLFPRGFGLTTE